MAQFGFASTAAEVLAGHDLSGRTALVTGGTSGIGKETARAHAAAGARVVITARDKAKAEEALDHLHQVAPGAEFDYALVDLASRDLNSRTCRSRSSPGGASAKRNPSTASRS